MALASIEGTPAGGAPLFARSVQHIDISIGLVRSVVLLQENSKSRSHFLDVIVGRVSCRTEDVTFFWPTHAAFDLRLCFFGADFQQREDLYELRLYLDNLQYPSTASAL